MENLCNREAKDLKRLLHTGITVPDAPRTAEGGLAEAGGGAEGPVEAGGGAVADVRAEADKGAGEEVPKNAKGRKAKKKEKKKKTTKQKRKRRFF